jgi:hypothetical protein
MRCQGTTKSGRPCKNKAIEGSSFCRIHTRKLAKKTSKKSSKKKSKKTAGSKSIPIGIADPLTLKADVPKRMSSLKFAQQDYIGEQIGEREDKMIGNLNVNVYKKYLYSHGEDYYTCGWTEKDALRLIRLRNGGIIGYNFIEGNHVTQFGLDDTAFHLLGETTLDIGFKYYNSPEQMPIPKPIGFTKCEDNNNAITWEFNESKNPQYSEDTDIATQFTAIADRKSLTFEQQVQEVKKLIVSCLFQLAYFVYCFAQENVNIRIEFNLLVATHTEADFEFRINNQTKVFHSVWNFSAFQFREETGTDVDDLWYQFLYELDRKIPRYFNLKLKSPPYPTTLSVFLDKSERGNQRFKDDDAEFNSFFTTLSENP